MQNKSKNSDVLVAPAATATPSLNFKNSCQNHPKDTQELVHASRSHHSYRNVLLPWMFRKSSQILAKILAKATQNSTPVPSFLPHTTPPYYLAFPFPFPFSLLSDRRRLSVLCFLLLPPPLLLSSSFRFLEDEELVSGIGWANSSLQSAHSHGNQSSISTGYQCPQLLGHGILTTVICGHLRCLKFRFPHILLDSVGSTRGIKVLLLLLVFVSSE